MVEQLRYLTFKYRNWKGQVGTRKVVPAKMWFGKTEYHPEYQWFLKAYDIDKREHRDFALNDIIHWGDPSDVDRLIRCDKISTEVSTKQMKGD